MAEKKVTYKEPASYFSKGMKRAVEEWEKEQAAKKKADDKKKKK